jgi:hypothetical protein
MCVCALKLALPRQVFLLRGNHETGTISKCYGFQTEVKQKYSFTLRSSAAVGPQQALAGNPVSTGKAADNGFQAKSFVAEQLIQHCKGASCTSR